MKKAITSKPSVFLDRDGVVNENKPQGVTSLGHFNFIPGSLSALAKLKSKGLQTFVVTNQPYVSKGEMTAEELDRINNYMLKEVSNTGGFITKVYTCSHSEDAECRCRKPNTALFEKSFREFEIDPKDSWIVGDQLSDIQAGKSLGMYTILVRTGEGQRAEKALSMDSKLKKPDYVVQDLREAVNIIIERVKQKKANGD